MTSYDVMELIKRSDNQEEIIDIAQNDSDWHIRQFAVAYIEDDEALKDILINDSINSVSIKAMEQISDIDFLIDVCLNNPFSHIRLATLNRIIDESLLLPSDLISLLNDVALNDPNEFIVKLAVENTNFNNPEVIMAIAESGRDVEIRKLAVSKITDENALSDFALNDLDVFIRREAILNPNLSNFDILSDVIRNDDDGFNRHWACEKITDKDYLVKLIFNKLFYHRLDDLSLNSNLNCEEYFKEVYETCGDEYHRLVSAYLIHDEIYLSNIVLNESDDKIRLQAIKNKHFSNQKILKELILSEDDQEIVFCAILKINDEDALINYIKRHLNDDKATLQTILQVNDVELLKELSRHLNPKIRLYAIKSFSNNFKDEYNSILKDIALRDESKNVCLEATGAITNHYDLMEIADKNDDCDIRALALNLIPASRLLDGFLFVHNSNRQSLDFKQKLKSLALNEKDDEIRHIAISKLDDKETLDSIASLENDDSEFAKRRLDSLFEDIKRIDNELLLKKLISSKDSDVSYIAQKTFDDWIDSQKHIDEISRISDIEKLKSIINDDFNYYVRCEAEGRLERLLFNIRLDEINEKSNQDKLIDIVKDETFPLEIRNKALSRVNDLKFKESYKILLD